MLREDGDILEDALANATDAMIQGARSSALSVEPQMAGEIEFVHKNRIGGSDDVDRRSAKLERFYTRTQG